MEWMKKLDMDPTFGDRFLNEGFSGGEKKRNEVLQMAILEPELAEQLRDLKVTALTAGSPGVIVSANAGCIAHLQAGTSVPVRHWIELIDESLGA